MPRAVIATTLVSGLLLVVAFAYLARRDGDRALRIWAWAFLVGAVRNVLDLSVPVFGGEPWFGWLFSLAAISQGYLLAYGTFCTLERPAPRWWAVVVVVALGWSGLRLVGVVSDRVELIPLFAGLAVIHLHAGIALLRAPDPGVGRPLSAVVLIVWGVHRANYPLLRDVGWFAPWGYAIATALAVSLAVGVLILHFERALERVRSVEASHRAFVDNAVVGVFRTTVAGRFEQANPAMAEMLGYDSVEELMSIDIAKALYPSDEARARAMQTPGERASGFVIEWLRKDGGAITVEITGRVIKLDDGSVFGYEGMARDVTRERALAEQLARSQRMELVGRLAGGVAHDFNNVLTSIQLYASMVERKLTNPEHRRDLGEIQRATTRASKLTQQLLAFGRRQVARPQRIDLSAELRRVAELLRRTLGDNVRIELEVPDAVVPLFADPMQIEQILVNLGVNARDAMAECGTLLIRLDFQANAPIGSAGITLVVSDTGSGIPAALLPRIFEPFFTMKEARGGTGLGLASVEAVVAELGGEIAVSSIEGEGTTFRITLNEAVGSIGGLPLAANDAAEGQAQRLDAHVLVVEDRASVRAAMVRALGEVGARTTEALDGEAALARLEREPTAFDLVVSDVIMPRLSGRELALGAQRVAPGLPFLFVSGNAGGELATGLAAHEAFLAKPFTAAELVQACRLALGTTPLRRDNLDTAQRTG